VTTAEIVPSANKMVLPTLTDFGNNSYEQAIFLLFPTKL
jgi:hypothetical protein